jgi:hypothetical protein
VSGWCDCLHAKEEKNYDDSSSVADPGVNFGSRILIFSIPDPNFFHSGSQIPNIIVSGWWDCLRTQRGTNKKQ